MGALVAQVGPVLVFLFAITVVAEIAESAGVFDVAGHAAVIAGRGRVWLLWLLVVALACVCTVLFSLDTTAVLLTPVVLAAARRVRVDPLPFAMTTVWLANTASLLLPVSNLSNLLAEYHFRAWGGVHGYLSAAWRPALVGIAVTVALLAGLHARALFGAAARRPYDPAPAPAVEDRVLLWIAGGVCVLLGPAFVSGVPPAIPALVGAAVLVGTLAIRDRSALRRIAVPWRMVLVLGVVFAAIRGLLHVGLAGPATSAVGSGTGAGALMRLAGVGAVAANAVNNLPAYLALEPTSLASPQRVVALLIGVNFGPVVTVWGSLATILWMQRCAAAGVRIRTRTFAWQGALLAVCAVAASAAVA